MAKSGKSANSVEAARELRQDIYVYNEATGFVISSEKMKGKGYEPDGNKWKKAVERGEIIPIELYQDDPFVIRVVLNGKLSDEEENEWLGKFTHKLRVSDGKLAISGGIEYIMEEFEEGESWIDDYARYLEIPSGEYKADIYTYVSSVNGTPLMEASGASDEPIGQFFRRSRPGTEFPEWLQDWLCAYSAEDPGHESEWQSRAKPDPKYFVDFLLHLTPLQEDERIEQHPLEMGFYNWTNMNIRKPELCPLGLAAEDLRGLPQVEESVPQPIQGVDVYSWISDFKCSKLDEPVELNLRDLKLAYLPSWYASNSAHPELRFTGNSLEALESIPLSKRTVFKHCSEKVLAIQLENSEARWETIARVHELGKILSEHKIPEALFLEVCTCWPKSMTDIAITRLKGNISDSIWTIAEVYPAMDSKTLRKAFDLGQQACEGKELSGLEKEPAELACDLFKEAWQTLFKNNMPELKDGRIRLAESDASLMHLFMSFYFRLAFNKIWSCEEIDGELLETAQQSKQRDALASKIILTGAASRKFVAASINTHDANTIKEAQQWQKDNEALGGKFIGELACTQFNGFIFRYFTMPHAASRMVWYSNDFMPGSFIEIICDFADGSSLSTSRQSGPPDDEKRKIYRERCPNTKLADMYKKHLKRAEKLAKEHGGFKSFDGTLLECARRFEEGIVRQSS